MDWAKLGSGSVVLSVFYARIEGDGVEDEVRFSRFFLLKGIKFFPGKIFQ